MGASDELEVERPEMSGGRIDPQESERPEMAPQRPPMHPHPHLEALPKFHPHCSLGTWRGCFPQPAWEWSQSQRRP